MWQLRHQHHNRKQTNREESLRGRAPPGSPDPGHRLGPGAL